MRAGFGNFCIVHKARGKMQFLLEWDSQRRFQGGCFFRFLLLFCLFVFDLFLIWLEIRDADGSISRRV